MEWFEGFEARHLLLPGGSIHVRTGGNPDRQPLLLLHGFPQSHAMWHRVAQALRQDFFLVLPDLRGYGDSMKPHGDPDHANYSKRVMAQDMVDLMVTLQHPTFFLCGHDRGARVAARLALDHPQRVRKLALVDIAPTLDMYESTDMRFARAYYHWFHLIQPAPLPEKMIGGDARFYLHTKLGGWGAGGLGHLEPRALAEYERCFCRAESIHAACEDYRASAGIDLEHDRESRARSRRIECDMLVLWGAKGLVGRVFKPIALWQAQCAGAVGGQEMPAGHFIPEELPGPTADALRGFFA
ncbi:MAG TPA: alpha/beta hydrolase [Ramlibacter sp.]|uniref:alpha/beta fold hydrolase n=1 Tax=Ramlibacter sp. TaxID=1917967 RepID=UPI002ED4B86E